MELERVIDLTILTPECTLVDIKKMCQEAVENQFYAVCVPPYYVKDADRILKNEAIKVVTVVGFPMGYSAIPSKVEEVKRAIDEGADEIDFVVNLCAVKNGDWTYISNEINSITGATHLKGKILKVIIEMELLTEEEIVKICEICNEQAVDFVKNSTGLNTPEISPEIVKKLRQYLNDSIKIKTCGVIKNRKHAMGLIEAGANRIGCTDSLNILK